MGVWRGVPSALIVGEDGDVAAAQEALRLCWGESVGHRALLSRPSGSSPLLCS